nr:immunoglobulin heavy chain junction region [Macaca mulatta]MOX60306.1 immunoglobulin heavy chain junction region [Macaca mulatta]MOX61049.1 immunoglobulin heavy chain junction region [Macaca mulatta]MOX62231.1 immunoglobulin heavy chain junction region [Macaca mulatta]MOX64293.1 immunoglobulin heavy chain junction region [Macaca mulatta]
CVRDAFGSGLDYW